MSAFWWFLVGLGVMLLDFPDTTEGRVDFRGTEWTARARAPVSAGTTVRILAKDNLTLRVEPVNPEEKS
jgi:membrane protein implicated in regulation of membrane protease activity